MPTPQLFILHYSLNLRHQMNQQETKRQLIALLKNQLTQNTGEVLQQLKMIFKDNEKTLNELILLLSQYNNLLSDRRKQIVSYSDFNIETRKINDSLLQLIDMISDREAEVYEIENAIFKRILVICPNKERKEAMEDLLPLRYYKGVECKALDSKDALKELLANNYPLMVFDDMQTDEDHYQLYEYCLQNAPAESYILYYGKRRALDTNAKGELKAYFSNSIFSFHSRLQEMFAYLKYRSTKNTPTS